MYLEVQPEPILFDNVLLQRVDLVALAFLLPFCMYSGHYLAFKLKPVVRHMNSSFSFKHNATDVKSWLL